MALCTKTGKHFSECFGCDQCAETRELMESMRRETARDDWREAERQWIEASSHPSYFRNV